MKQGFDGNRTKMGKMELTSTENKKVAFTQVIQFKLKNMLQFEKHMTEAK